jgi:magnesium-transporting ATPase (P-type)
VVVMVLVFYLLNCRSLTDSMFAVGVFSNRWIYAGIVAMVAAQLLFTYAPIMNRLFHTAPISGQAWLRILAVAVAGYALVGIEKWLRRRWAKARGEHPRQNGKEHASPSRLVLQVGDRRALRLPPGGGTV